jgi:acyl carrier protein
MDRAVLSSMNDSELWDALTLVFHDVFGNDTITIGHATTANDIDEWDSLNHVQLILAVEAKFHIRFPASEVASFECVGDMVSAIKRRLNS